MSFLLTLLLLGVIAACVGVLYTEGMWSNAIRLVNVVTAALLAMNFFEPLANFLTEYISSLTYVWDYASLWGLFILFFLALSEATNRISRVKVRFLKIADQVGGGVFAFLIGWVMVCFIMTTLHAAPMARTFFFGGFNAESRMFLGLAPDRQWLGFTKNVSSGAFCRSPVSGFDPKNDFLSRYATRRANFESQIDSRDSLLAP